MMHISMCVSGNRTTAVRRRNVRRGRLTSMGFPVGVMNMSTVAVVLLAVTSMPRACMSQEIRPVEEELRCALTHSKRRLAYTYSHFTNGFDTGETETQNEQGTSQEPIHINAAATVSLPFATGQEYDDGPDSLSGNESDIWSQPSPTDGLPKSNLLDWTVYWVIVLGLEAVAGSTIYCGIHRVITNQDQPLGIAIISVAAFMFIAILISAGCAQTHSSVMTAATRSLLAWTAGLLVISGSAGYMTLGIYHLSVTKTLLKSNPWIHVTMGSGSVLVLTCCVLAVIWNHPKECNGILNCKGKEYGYIREL